jgi:hypothetical protein
MGMIFSSDNVPDFGSIRLTKKRYNNVNDYIFKVEDLSKLSLITNAAEGSTALATDTGDLYILHMGLWSILGGESEESATNAAQAQTLNISPLNINRGELTGGVNLEDETEIKPEEEESEESEAENTTVEEMR